METITEEDIKELLVADEKPRVSIYMSTIPAGASQVQEKCPEILMLPPSIVFDVIQ